MQDVQRGYGLSRILDDMHRRSEERAVNGRIDEILAASNGGQQDLTTLDPKLYSDRIGMEAMGKVSQKLSQTGEFQTKIFENGIKHAQKLYGLAQGYMTDFTKATEAGDEPRARAIMGAMVNQFNIPYRFTPEGDGFRVTHITPEGEVDAGTMSLYDAYGKIKDFVNDEKTFVKGSAAYNMTNWETNMKYMADTSKWRIGVTKDGKQLAMVPQMFSVNGQLVGGFYVEGLGNRTLQQLADAGIRVGGVTGAGLAEQQAKAAARAAGRGRRGSGTAGAEEQVTTATGEGGSVKIPQSVYDKADGLFAKGATDPETKQVDSNYVAFMHNLFARSYGKGGTARNVLATLENARRVFNKNYADKLEGKSFAEQNQLFATWYVNAMKQKAAQQKQQDDKGKTADKPDGQDQKANPPKQPMTQGQQNALNATKPPAKKREEEGTGLNLVDIEAIDDMPN